MSLRADGSCRHEVPGAPEYAQRQWKAAVRSHSSPNSSRSLHARRCRGRPAAVAQGMMGGCGNRLSTASMMSDESCTNDSSGSCSCGTTFVRVSGVPLNQRGRSIHVIEYKTVSATGFEAQVCPHLRAGADSQEKSRTSHGRPDTAWMVVAAASFGAALPRAAPLLRRPAPRHCTGQEVEDTRAASLSPTLFS